jgi:hypothetical protein
VPSVLRCAKSNAWGRKNAVYMVVHRLFADETLTLLMHSPSQVPAMPSSSRLQPARVGL